MDRFTLGMAGAYLPADIYARYKRLCENDVAFICGSDEHGVAISIKAKQEGSSVKSIIDKYHNLIKDTFEEFGISFDNYSRTSNAIHHETSKQFLGNWIRTIALKLKLPNNFTMK